MLRFALAGTGGIAATHARAIQNQPDTQITAVVTTKADGAAEFCARFGIPQAFGSVEALVNSRAADALSADALSADALSADALIVCTPNALHAPQTLQALRGGLHVLVEKPMAMNAAEAAEMLRASRETGRILLVGHCWRFDTEVLWLKERAAQLGRVIRTRSLGMHTLWGPTGWFTQKALAGGGALADMGIHAIDTTRFLLGDPRPVSVYARLGRYYGPSDVDDTGLVWINWDNGATSLIESGWWQPHADGPEAATQLYAQGGYGSLFPTRLELLDPARHALEVVDPGFAFPRPDHGPQIIYDRQMACFIDSIHSGQQPVPGGLEGWTNMRITDAAYESSRTGKVIDISS